MFENMSKREKLLAGSIGILLLMGAVIFGFLDFFKQYEDNASRLKQLKKNIQKEEFKMQLAFKASDRQGFYYEPISFPTGKTEITVYQDWLEKTIRKTGLRKIDIGSPKIDKLTFTSGNNTVFAIGKKYGITFVGEASLDEILDFIYRFEEVNLLHRIKDLTLLPLRKKGTNVTTGQVKSTFKVELLALEDAVETREFWTSTKELPLALGDYKDDIIGRNIFGPANNAPTLRISNKTVEVDEDISITLSGKDKDKNDELTYEIVDAGGIVDAKIKSDSKTRAKFVAGPMPVGEYVGIIKVSDNGFPQKSFETEFKLTVEEKPDPPAEVKTPDPPPPPKVLEGPSTQITRISSRDGVYQVKIRNRMRGEVYVLNEGDEIELDDKTWVIHKIHSQFKVTIEVDGKLVPFDLGDFLELTNDSASDQDDESAGQDDPVEDGSK